MSSPAPTRTAKWVKCTPTFIKPLPQLKFPFETPPDIYLPDSTVLHVEDGRQVYAFKWCYLNRKGEGRRTLFDANSLSKVRVEAMPQALNRLSKWLRFKNARPQSVHGVLNIVGQLLNWADQPEQGGRFEAILSDPDLALEALESHHRYLRSQLQSHQIASMTAGLRDQLAISCLSEIHSRPYRDHIEPLQARKGAGVKAPDSSAVAQFGSMLQAVFDSAAQIILHGNPEASVRVLRLSASDEGKTVELRPQYGPLRLMELACVAYTGLVIMDSGVNLSAIAQYEEPEDLNQQLADPDRINLKEKAIKFRAGGKAVQIFLSATSLTRLKSYLDIRQSLVAALGGTDVAPLFVQCKYEQAKGEPTAVRPLPGEFLDYLRKKFIAIGAPLPAVTLRELRAYAQQRFARTASLPVAAKRLGHTIRTAIEAYCKAQEVTHRGEMAKFLSSLQRTVLDASEDHGEKVTETIPAGGCADYGKPYSATQASVVEPDCSKVEGCFFCSNYRVHAEEGDMRKLMSCRRVLSIIAPLNGESLRTEQVYSAVVARIDALLWALKCRQPKVYEEVRVDVEEHGQLTRYWERKLQQLHLLGMLPAEAFKKS